MLLADLALRQLGGGGRAVRQLAAVEEHLARCPALLDQVVCVCLCVPVCVCVCVRACVCVCVVSVCIFWSLRVFAIRVSGYLTRLSLGDSTR